MYMEKNYRDDISLQTLASVCGISTQHFCRVFHDKIGMRPMEYLAMKRISSAKVALLDTNAAIAQIGKRVGYKDANYFGIVFKKYEGISPREYRNSHNHIG
jgi:AraC family transcriptional regulator of arabinose operon